MKVNFKYFLLAATLISWVVAISLLCSPGLERENEGEDVEPSLATKGSDQPRRTNILILGSDDSSGLTDVMMIASYNEADESISVVQIPRDSYAEYGDGTSYKKINGAKNKLGGERELCDFFEELLCIDIGYYISVDLDALEGTVDALGGVEVDIPFDMDYEDPEQDLYIHLKKGKRLLSGDEARQFVRYRSGYLRGDVGRIDAQKLFLASLIRRLKSEASLLDTASVAFGLLEDIRTDMPYMEIIRLARSALEVPLERISFVTLAGEDAVAKKSGASYYVISRASAIEIVNVYLGGNASEERFDEERRLLNDDYPEFGRIYFSFAGYSVSNADSLCEKGIDIQLK